MLQPNNKISITTSMSISLMQETPITSSPPNLFLAFNPLLFARGQLLINQNCHKSTYLSCLPVFKGYSEQCNRHGYLFRNINLMRQALGPPFSLIHLCIFLLFLFFSFLSFSLLLFNQCPVLRPEMLVASFSLQYALHTPLFVILIYNLLHSA